MAARTGKSRQASRANSAPPPRVLTGLPLPKLTTVKSASSAAGSLRKALGGILDQHSAGAVRQRLKRCHLLSNAHKVDGDDGHRLWTHDLLHGAQSRATAYPE